MDERLPVGDWATDFDHLSDDWAAHGPEILTELPQRVYDRIGVGVPVLTA